MSLFIYNFASNGFVCSLQFLRCLGKLASNPLSDLLKVEDVGRVSDQGSDDWPTPLDHFPVYVYDHQSTISLSLTSRTFPICGISSRYSATKQATNVPQEISHSGELVPGYYLNVHSTFGALQ